MKLTPKLNSGWILRQGDDSLNESLFRWLNKYERSGKMSELHSFYYGFLKIFDYYDTKARGNEPVHYVDAIQHYYDIIVKHELEIIAKKANGSKK